MSHMKILVVEPAHSPNVTEIINSLEAMQNIVGGLIQIIYPFDDLVAIVANDEGKLLGLPLNRVLRDDDGNIYDILCGIFFICGIHEDRCVSLTEEQVEKFRRIFAVPEIFVNFNRHLVVLPMDEEKS